MLKHHAKRWAVVSHFRSGHPYFLGKYCWGDARPGDLPTRTFETRREARAAAKLVSLKTKVVRVDVVIKEIQQPK